MRNFVVSDLHGNGEVYNSIMTYLENVSKEDDVTLYINGDLIDRGSDSFEMLMDVYKRCHNLGNIKIQYLAGNHEWLMYQSLIEIINHKGDTALENWERFGGRVTLSMLEELTEDELIELKDFLGDLKIYHYFNESVGGKRVALVHSRLPMIAPVECNMRLKDQKNVDNKKCVEDPVFKSVWYRPTNENILNYHPYLLTIIGHNPILKYPGFAYFKKSSIIDIDGGCAGYALGRVIHDHCPLVEVKDGQLDFLVFNHNNEITGGRVFNGEVIDMDSEILNYNRQLLGNVNDSINNRRVNR